MNIALDAWRDTVSDKFPDLVLRIVRKGKKVPALVKAKGLERVEISPFTAEPEAYYAQARLVLMPSMFEGWGSVPLELLACGVPVVVSQQVPSSGVISEAWQGCVIDRNGHRDADQAMVAQLQRDDADEVMQQRHARVQQFVAQQATTLSWLLENV